MLLKHRLANITLFALTVSFLILLGGGNYEALNVTQKLASAPPKSLAILQGEYRFFPVPFWIIFHMLTEILLVAALVFNWRVSLYRRKVLLFVCAGALILRVVTMIYFAPETGAIASAPFSNTVDPELLARAQRWEFWNYIRLGAYYVLGITLLFAVNRSLVTKRADLV
jgi:hypothetical protein